MDQRHRPDAADSLGGWHLIVTVVERQVHGYRQGHQLIAASEQMLKEDQSVIDRLSDVAGPLRPRERFDPYLTSYLLPSGERYVLARTWQDLTVARAGCVRTASLIIPVDDWATAESLSPFLDLLQSDRLPQEADATRKIVSCSTPMRLPPAPESGASELLEALFLEEAKPIVVFDAPVPELIAVRLLTAMWPSLRRRYAISTFALSPRKVGKLDFDLVFAPKDARAKFADWKGRRINGRSGLSARHRWTGLLVSRIFEQPFPQLLTSKEIGLVSVNDEEVDDAMALRIVLLWNELAGKLETTPTAALGLLDLANSGKILDALALQTLEPFLADSVHRAALSLPEAEAWDFLGAIARKLHRRSMPRGVSAVGAAAEQLAARSPEGAFGFLGQLDPEGGVIDLLPRIAEGLGKTFDERIERALLVAKPDILGRLIAQSRTLAERVAGDAPLIDRLGEVLADSDPLVSAAMAADLLPFLTADWQIPAARPLLMMLDGQGLADEIRHLGQTNDFAASRLAELALERARTIGAREKVRFAISELPASERRNAMLARTLDPSTDDAAWLLQTSKLSADAVSSLLSGMLSRANDGQLSAIIGDGGIGAEVIRTLEDGGIALLQRALFVDHLPVDSFVQIVLLVLSRVDANGKLTIAQKALNRCLRQRFEGEEQDFITTMLDIVGERLDGTWAIRTGLERKIPASITSRNMVAFCRSSQPARLNVIYSIAEMAEVLRGRRSFDLNVAAAGACAHLLFEAEKAAPRALLSAAGFLLPVLIRQTKDPVSLMIAAAFPVLYRELAKKDDVPDLLQFVPFFDWDRCKAARRELVFAFMSSDWAPGDLALTACRCDDVGKILRLVAKSYGGDIYIDRVAADIGRLPDSCRETVERSISRIKSDQSSKYDWRD